MFMVKQITFSIKLIADRPERGRANAKARPHHSPSRQWLESGSHDRPMHSARSVDRAAFKVFIRVKWKLTKHPLSRIFPSPFDSSVLPPDIL
jgi:hypothetical protein